MVEQYTPEKLVSGVISLVTLPEICRKINLTLADPDHSRQDVERLVSQDPALTLRILRIVNSSYYALSRKIDRIDQALSIIGEDDLRNMILATSAAAALKHLDNPLIDFHKFWRHSVECGLMARAIARRCRYGDCEILFTAGLLHDIGKVVLYHQLPELAHAVLYESKTTGCHIEVAEHRLLNFDHGQVGGALASAWQLPEILCSCISFHHQPSQAEALKFEAGMVHIGNALSNWPEKISAQSKASEIEHLDIDNEVFDSTGLNFEALVDIVSEVQEQCSEVQALFCSSV